MKKIIFVLTLMLSLLLLACNGEIKYEISFEGEDTIELSIGDTYELKYSLTNDGTAGIELYSDIVTLEGNMLTAVKEGSSSLLIYCNEDKGITKEVNIIVKAKISSLNIDVKTELVVGEEVEIKVIPNEEGELNLTYSLDNDVLSINEETKKLVANKTGKAVLTVKDEVLNISANVEITVLNKIESFDVSDLVLKLEEEKELQISYDNTCKVEFILSTKDDIVTVDGLKVKANKTGKTVITVTDKITNLSKEVNVEVKKVLTDFVVVFGEAVVGKEVTADYSYEKDVEVNFEITFSNDNLTLENGKIIAKKEGNVKVTVLEINSGIVKEYDLTVEKGKEDPDQLLNNLLDWAINEVGTCGEFEVILPETHPDYQCEYVWESSDESIFALDGFLEYLEFDTDVDITCKVIYEGKEKSKTFTFTILGYAFQELAQKFEKQFPGGRIFQTMNLVTNYPDYYGGTIIKWESSNPDVFTNKGEYIKPVNNTNIILYYTIQLGSPNLSRNFEVELEVEGMTITDVKEEIVSWAKDNIGINGAIDENTIFPNYLEEYGAELIWFDAFGNPLVVEKFVGNPIYSQGVDVQLKIIYKGHSALVDLHYNTLSAEITDMWDAIEIFTNTISEFNVREYEYNLVNWNSFEKGYIPFYNNNDSQIIESILPYTYGKQRTGIKKSSTEYVVVHDTGNPGAGANAEMHNRYITNLNNDSKSSSISWHFTVDERSIYQHLPLDEVAWHAGDGSRKYGEVYFNNDYQAWSIGGGNYNGIGIESCIDKGSDYTKTMRILAKLVAELLIDFELSIDRVKQHNHFSGKNCPQVMRENDRWNEFILLVQLEYFAKTTLKGVKFEWKSLSDCLDNTGRVTSDQPVGTKLNYQVTATYQGESKTYTYTSVLKAR